MKKYQIILMIGLGVFSFTAAFGFNWFRNQKSAAAAVAQSAAPVSDVSPAVTQERQTPLGTIGGQTWSDAGDEHLGITERQLQHLIYDVREKMREYNLREREQAAESARIELARKSLQDDIEQLNQLREQLDIKLASLKEKEEQIQKTVFEIEGIERANLQRLAATYDRMDAAQAGRIMVTMAANNQLQDVVKILYYMNDRNAARVLGEIGATQPEVAGVLSLQLKRVKEGE